MDWDKLRIFQAVADAGSFTHAGESLKLSQSAISRQIGALEEQLGVMLFHRHARGLILTEQGELLYRTARDMAAKVNTAEALLRANQDKPAGRLKVTTTVGFGSTWLTAQMHEFITMYPDIDVSLVLSDNELDLGMREADVAIRMMMPRQPGLVQRHLLTVQAPGGRGTRPASPDHLRRGRPGAGPGRQLAVARRQCRPVGTGRGAAGEQRLRHLPRR